METAKYAEHAKFSAAKRHRGRKTETAELSTPCRANWSRRNSVKTEAQRRRIASRPSTPNPQLSTNLLPLPNLRHTLEAMSSGFDAACRVTQFYAVFARVKELVADFRTNEPLPHQSAKRGV
jgi:hypothetical protein